MDFVALMKYPGPDERVLRALDFLEAESPEELQGVARVMQEHEFSVGRKETAVWKYQHRPELRDKRLDCRPVLPILGIALHLPEDFFLTFGSDAFEVYHLLRWHFFLEEPDLQEAMLTACSRLAHLFGATDCIITSDFNPVIHAFRKGDSFDKALSAAGPEDGERQTVIDLCRSEPEAKGYWRPRLPDLLAGVGTSPPQKRYVSPVRLMQEAEWETSKEPDLMLETLLRNDNVSRRKVQLWACACVKRVEHLLEMKTSRQVLEITERFLEGKARLQEVEHWCRNAQRVRKGNRSATRAAYLAARLCASPFTFPPGDISEAAAEATSDGALEKKEQAVLLRDIFARPGPPMLDPAWLTSTVTSLAQAIYADRAFDRMPILADALEDAGCTDASILEHCRGGGEHVRGCWVVDLLTGRE
jgi:hypothetical protein